MSPLVRVDSTRDTKFAALLIYQHCSHSGCPLIVGGDGLGILREDIRHHKHILHSVLRWLQYCKIHSQNLVWACSKEVAHVRPGRGLGVLSYLAPFTLLAPALHILLHAWPVTPPPNQVDSPFHTLMSMFMVQLMQNLTLQ